jgi:hypothetical protein
MFDRRDQVEGVFWKPLMGEVSNVDVAVSVLVLRGIPVSLSLARA